MSEAFRVPFLDSSNRLRVRLASVGRTKLDVQTTGARGCTNVVCPDAKPQIRKSSRTKCSNKDGISLILQVIHQLDQPIIISSRPTTCVHSLWTDVKQEVRRARTANRTVVMSLAQLSWYRPGSSPPLLWSICLKQEAQTPFGSGFSQSRSPDQVLEATRYVHSKCARSSSSKSSMRYMEFLQRLKQSHVRND